MRKMDLVRKRPELPHRHVDYGTDDTASCKCGGKVHKIEYYGPTTGNDEAAFCIAWRYLLCGACGKRSEDKRTWQECGESW